MLAVCARTHQNSTHGNETQEILEPQSRSTRCRRMPRRWMGGGYPRHPRPLPRAVHPHQQRSPHHLRPAHQRPLCGIQPKGGGRVSARAVYYSGGSCATPFRHGAWAVADGRTLLAWCMSADTAELLKLAINAKKGSKPDELRLQAAIIEGAK